MNQVRHLKGGGELVEEDERDSDVSLLELAPL